jgi:hypothetical protein
MPVQDEDEDPVIFEQYPVILQFPTMAPPQGVKAPHWPDPLSPQPSNQTQTMKSDLRMKLSLVSAEKFTPSRRG